MRFVQAAASIIATNYSMDIEGAEEFVAGVMYGLIQKDDLPEIQKCLTNGEKLEVEITNALSDFSKGDIQDMIKAVQEFGMIIQELPQDLQDCENIEDDVKKIETWAAIFANPVTLVTTLTKNLLANWKEVSAEITKTTSDYNAAKYYDAGEDVADVVVLAVGPISAAEQADAEIDWELLNAHLAENMTKMFLW